MKVADQKAVYDSLTEQQKYQVFVQMVDVLEENEILAFSEFDQDIYWVHTGERFLFSHDLSRL